MGGSNGWRTAIDGSDYLRGMEKRLLHEERRPQIRTSADILGPGIAPYCVRLEDWSADETLFNGFWYTEPGSFNAPDNSRYWMGYSLATEAGFGFERVTEYYGPLTDVAQAWPRPVYVRKFWTPNPDVPRQWSAWRLEDGTPPGTIADYGGSTVALNTWNTGSNASAWTPASGFSISRQETRRVADNLISVDVEWTRTGAVITRPASGDIANTQVATLNVAYTPAQGQTQLASGRQGRCAHFCFYSDRTVAMTSIGGTSDYATGEDGSFGGIIPVAAIAQDAPTVAAPNGWFYCNGAVKNRADYPDLFAAIGTRWNTGGESGTQFRIPNLSGKVIRA